MRIHTCTAFKKWRDLVYGPHPTQNVMATERMLIKWDITELDHIGYYLNRHPNIKPITFNVRLAILKRFIKWCIKEKYIKSNPLEDIKTRKNDESNPARNAFTDEELRLLLDYFEKSPRLMKYYLPFIKFLMYTGCRNGEAIGLKWDCIDFVNKRIHIRRSYTRSIYGVKKHLKSPKTSAGNRIIPMTEDLEVLLMPLAKNKKPDDFVFVTVYKNPIDDRNFQKRVFAPALKKLGIPHRHLYAMRHTFGTIAVEQNMDILSVAYLMGHKKPRTVLDHYTNLRYTPKQLPKINPASRRS